MRRPGCAMEAAALLAALILVGCAPAVPHASGACHGVPIAHHHRIYWAGFSGESFTRKYLCSTFGVPRSVTGGDNEVTWDYTPAGAHIPLKFRRRTWERDFQFVVRAP